MQRTEHGSICSFRRLDQGLWYRLPWWTVENPIAPWFSPKFLTILRQLHEGQQGQAKHNGSLSGSFPISNGVKQGCVLAPTLFSIFFSIVLREAKEDLPDGIYIRFRTDGSLFNLSHLLARMKTIEKLITELLFADDCALLAHTEEALQHIINCFSDVAKNFSLAISLKKTGVVPTPSTRGIQSFLHQNRWHQPKRSGTLHLHG